jgi:putative acetyltransferase
MMKPALTLQDTKQKLTICLLESPKEAKKINLLLHEYHQDIGVDLSLDGFEYHPEDILNRYTYPNGLFFLAKNNDLILGMAGILFLNSKVCEIKRIYVKRRWRRRGIALCLIQSATSTAQALGYRRALFIALERFKAAVALYNDLGFRQIDNDPIKKENYSDLISFELDIDTEEKKQLWRLKKYVGWDIRYCEKIHRILQEMNYVHHLLKR